MARAHTSIFDGSRPAFSAPLSTCASLHSSIAGCTPKALENITPSATSPASSSILGPLAPMYTGICLLQNSHCMG